MNFKSLVLNFIMPFSFFLTLDSIAQQQTSLEKEYFISPISKKTLNKASDPDLAEFLSTIETSGAKGHLYKVEFSSAFQKKLGPAMSQVFSGYFFKLTSPPHKSISNGKAIFLRDELVQSKIEEIIEEGISVVLIPKVRGVNGFVLRSDDDWKKELISVMGNTKDEILLGLSLNASFGTLIHEYRHIQQEKPDDHIKEIKKALHELNLSEHQIAALKRFIVEFDAYQVQKEYIKDQSILRPNQRVWWSVNITKISDGQRLKSTEYENHLLTDYYEYLIPEIERSISWHSVGAKQVLNQVLVEDLKTYCKVLNVLEALNNSQKAQEYLQLEYKKCN